MNGVPTARERPVAVPRDLDDSAPIDGIVRLPLSIRRSGEPIEYDLSNPRHLRNVYKQVLRANKLVEVWDDLFLPAYARAAWKPSLQRRRVSQP